MGCGLLQSAQCRSFAGPSQVLRFVQLIQMPCRKLLETPSFEDFLIFLSKILSAACVNVSTWQTPHLAFDVTFGSTCEAPHEGPIDFDANMRSTMFLHSE